MNNACIKHKRMLKFAGRLGSLMIRVGNHLIHDLVQDRCSLLTILQGSFRGGTDEKTVYAIASFRICLV